MAKRITEIPATKSRYTAQPIANPGKRKVAGYARVSTDREDQETSYEAQIEYYTSLIQSKPEWEYVGMYSDEGITGTNTKKRDGFRQMVEDALSGKIDLIITKSVSRFARNTVDSLTTVRKLKERGIEIYFEKENIWTLDAKGELLITIMSSLAQEESRSISENVTWGLRKRFSDGKGSVAFGCFLGYDKGENGEWKVNEEQAATVRLIYRMYLSGLSFDAVAKELEKMGLQAPAGGYRWHPRTVKSILMNEKYKGDALLQKEYTVDFLTKKKAKNHGEIPQYYVEGHHEAIVTPQQFALVQNEIERRSAIGNRYSGMSIFSSKFICGECGSCYGPKIWHSNDKYRKKVWRCNYRYGKSKCHTPHVTEEEVKAAFVKAYNELVSNEKNILEDLAELKAIRTDTGRFKAELEVVGAEIKSLVTQTENLISENARSVRNQEEYTRQYNDLTERYEAKKAEYENLNKKISSAEASGAVIDDFIMVFRDHAEPLTEFDPLVWGCLVEKVTINTDKNMVFRFKSGTEITVNR